MEKVVCYHSNAILKYWHVSLRPTLVWH